MSPEQHDPIVIVSAVRTPLGGLQGALAPLPAPQIGAVALRAALERAKIEPHAVDEVLIGNVLSAGQGQAPARQAALAAGLPESCGCTTINKMCGSGMKTVMLAHDLLLANTNRIMLAGGMESMSNAPYLLLKARRGMRLGHGEIKDHMFLDGLEDAYDQGRLMGTFAEATADEYGFGRDQQDAFALRSLDRAIKASNDGLFNDEIEPIIMAETTVDRDEQPFSAKPSKIPKLRPAFRPDGTVTAANSSSISDGAAALLLMRRSQAEKMGVTPLAVIRGHATHAQQPAWFTTAPVGAIRTLLERVGWGVKDVDLFEVNEAFAVVTMAAQQDLGLPSETLNIHGGACALGHPIGASGARILVTLCHALRHYNLARGVAALCIGGGEATAMALEITD